MKNWVRKIFGIFPTLINDTYKKGSLVQRELSTELTEGLFDFIINKYTYSIKVFVNIKI